MKSTLSINPVGKSVWDSVVENIIVLGVRVGKAACKHQNSEACCGNEDHHIMIALTNGIQFFKMMDQKFKLNISLRAVGTILEHQGTEIEIEY